MEQIKPRISLIAAVAERNRGIGKDNALLWDIKTDLRHFKDVTSGHPVILGEKTFHSIGRPLPGRTNIVLSDNPEFSADGVVPVFSLDEAFEKARETGTEEVFVIGGASVYAQTISRADRLYLTLVEGEFDADTFFPDWSDFPTVISEEPATEGEYRFRFLILER